MGPSVDEIGTLSGEAPAAGEARPRLVRSMLLTSGGQAMAMGTGGLLAILIAARFGGSGRTDGFFAAYAVYGLILLIAQSTRLTVVPRLVGGPDRFSGFDAFVAALGVLWLGCGVVLVPLGGPLADLLTGTADAQSTARDAFLVLWPAAGAQLFAALGAAMLGVLGRYGEAAAGYVAGSVATVAAFLALAGPLGVGSVAVALLIGAAVTAIPVVHALVGARWRPRAGTAGVGRRAGLVLVGAASVAAPQLLYVIAMAAAAHIETGAPTTFSYGFFATQVFVSMLAGSLSIVLAAPIASGWDRRPASLSGQIGDAFGLSLLVLVPAVAVIALVGDDIAAPLLSGFTDEQIDAVIRAFLALSPSILAAQATAIPLVALYALHRHAPIARLAVGAAVLQVGLAAAAVVSDGIVALAAATSVSSLAFAGGLYALLYGRAAVGEAGRRLWDLARIGVPVAACFVVPALTRIPDAVALVVGLALFALLVALALPDGRRLVAQLGGWWR